MTAREFPFALPAALAVGLIGTALAPALAQSSAPVVSHAGAASENHPSQKSASSSLIVLGALAGGAAFAAGGHGSSAGNSSPSQVLFTQALPASSASPVLAPFLVAVAKPTANLPVATINFTSDKSAGSALAVTLPSAKQTAAPISLPAMTTAFLAAPPARAFAVTPSALSQSPLVSRGGVPEPATPVVMALGGLILASLLVRARRTRTA